MKLPVLLLPIFFCIWDSDTLDDELRGLPDAEQIVNGRWFRHGEAYYRQRIATLPAQLEKNPRDLQAHDDLAVAHERLGDRDAAIAVMKRKAEALKDTPDPEHQYRYHANLGTFHAHAGQLEQALVELEKAVTLNPDAHFGRERFQIDLIRYVLEARKNPEVWTEHDFLTWSGYRVSYSGLTPGSFTGSVGEKEKETTWQKAYTAVVGMLRFGGLEGAELYRTLGDLFSAHGDLNLAWWCYQYAIEKKHPAAERIAYAVAGIEEHWDEAGLGDPPTMDTFRAVRKNADQWLANFHRAEEAALARGEHPGDPDVLKQLVEEADRATPPAPVGQSSWLRLLLMGAGGAALIAAVVFFLRRRRSRRER